MIWLRFPDVGFVIFNRCAGAPESTRANIVYGFRFVGKSYCTAFLDCAGLLKCGSFFFDGFDHVF